MLYWCRSIIARELRHDQPTEILIRNELRRVSDAQARGGQSQGVRLQTLALAHRLVPRLETVPGRAGAGGRCQAPVLSGVRLRAPRLAPRPALRLVQSRAHWDRA